MLSAEEGDIFPCLLPSSRRKEREQKGTSHAGELLFQPSHVLRTVKQPSYIEYPYDIGHEKTNTYKHYLSLSMTNG